MSFTSRHIESKFSYVSVKYTQTGEQEVKKLSISFKVEVPEGEVLNFEYFLKDLLESSVLPALSSTLVPLTLEVKKARN